MFWLAMPTYAVFSVLRQPKISFVKLVTSGARSAERVLLWFKGEISVCAAHPDPTQPDPTETHHAFEKLISLERVDRFTSGLLCSMSPFN